MGSVYLKQGFGGDIIVQPRMPAIEGDTPRATRFCLRQ